MAQTRPSDATREHLEALLRKRAAIQAAIEDSYSAFLAAVAREEQTPEEAVALYQWVTEIRSSKTVLPAPRVRLVEALGHDEADLRAWLRDPRNLPGTEAIYCEGIFPVDRQWTPREGRPCVYALLSDGVVVYIGRSRNVSPRLKQHWRGSEKEVDAWRVYQCAADEDSISLEAALIRGFAPRYNRAGNPFATAT